MNFQILSFLCEFSLIVSIKKGNCSFSNFLICCWGENPVNWEGRRIDQVLSGLFYTLANHKPTKKYRHIFSTTCSLVNEVYYSLWKRLINHFTRFSFQAVLLLMFQQTFFAASSSIFWKLMNFYWHNNQQMTFTNWAKLSFVIVSSHKKQVKWNCKRDDKS